MDYIFLLKGLVLQVVIFCGVPFFVWLLRHKKQTSFFNYLGLKPAKRTGGLAALVTFALIYLAVYGAVHFIPFLAALTQPSASAYAGLGAAALLPALLVCFVQQAFAEEVLFRGFIGKRFVAKWGFSGGNAAQAAVFGLVHVLLSINNERGLTAYLILFASITAGGWLLGYLDEKLCQGSILPSILLHGAGNYLMILTVAF